MKSMFSTAVAGLFLLSAVFMPQSAMAKKGGIGHGGGVSDDGILYHSHSDRSYSGKDQFKGKGKASGRDRVKSQQGKAGKNKVEKMKGGKQKFK